MGLRTKPFTLDVGKEDRVIRGEIRLPETSGTYPVVVICHGFKGFKDWGFFPYTGEQLAAAGLAAITFNFSMNGVGENSETFEELDKFARNTFSREQEDLARIFQEMEAGSLPFHEELDLNRLGLLGHSRGGANSLLFALDHPFIDGVALWNSVARTDFFADELKQEIQEKGRGWIPNARTGQNMPIDREVLEDIEQHREQFDLLQRLTDYEKPILILQGEEDPAVSLKSARSLREAASHSQLHTIPHAGHTFNAVHPFQGSTDALDEALKKTITFFRKIFN